MSTNRSPDEAKTSVSRAIVIAFGVVLGAAMLLTLPGMLLGPFVATPCIVVLVRRRSLGNAMLWPAFLGAAQGEVVLWLFAAAEGASLSLGGMVIFGLLYAALGAAVQMLIALGVFILVRRFDVGHTGF